MALSLVKKLSRTDEIRDLSHRKPCQQVATTDGIISQEIRLTTDVIISQETMPTADVIISQKTRPRTHDI